MGRFYTVSFTSIAQPAATQDYFEILTPAANSVIIHSIRIAQSSEEGDAQAEMLPIQIARIPTGTDSGSGGTAATPAPTVPGDVAGTTVETNNTSAATNPTVVLGDAWNVQVGWLYQPTPEERIELGGAERIAVQSADPADAMTVSGSMTFEEIG